MPKLHYYQATGRGNQVRLTLAAAGIDWEEVYPAGFPPTPEEKDAWRAIGKNLTTNVPMLEMDDGTAYTQSSAVVRAVARLGNKNGFNLMPTDDHELYLVDKIIADAEDLRTVAYGTFLSWGAPQSKVDDFIDNGLPLHLKNFDRQLNGDFFVGSSLTVADICAYDAMVNFGSNRVLGALDNFPKLKSFATRVEENPNIAKYLASDKYKGLFQFDVITKAK